MHLSKFVHSQSGKYIMSIILGFGLATLFRTVCKGKNCVILHAPPLSEIKDKIFKHEDKCYKFNAVSTKCNINKKTVEYA
jgi:hypothetical protein